VDRWIKRLGLIGIGGIYLFFLVIYTDDSSGYRWINENFYFAELWVATGLISLLLLVGSIIEYRRAAVEDRSWRVYRAFMLATILSLLFPVFAGVLALASYSGSV
jgi:hypothetical protein